MLPWRRIVQNMVRISDTHDLMTSNLTRGTAVEATAAEEAVEATMPTAAAWRLPCPLKVNSNTDLRPHDIKAEEGGNEAVDTFPPIAERCR